MLGAAISSRVSPLSGAIAPPPPTLRKKAPEDSSRFANRRHTVRLEHEQDLRDRRAAAGEDEGELDELNSRPDGSSFFRDPYTPPGFISPGSDFQEKWDILLLTLLVYVMVVTPFEVVFLQPVAVLCFPPSPV